MKNLLMFSFFAFSLVMSGCGKKKCDIKDKETKTVSAADGNIPMYTAANDDLIEDGEVSEFAFADDEDSFFDATYEKGGVVTSNKHASLSVEKDEDLLASNDESAQFDVVQFDFNKNDIKVDQKTAVKKDVSIAKKVVQEGKNVVVAGHTCQIGSASYNIALSQRRAEAVKAEMLKEGIPAKNIKTLGMGYESPLVWSDKSDRSEKIAELSPNRRAEVSVN